MCIYIFVCLYGSLKINNMKNENLLQLCLRHSQAQTVRVMQRVKLVYYVLQIDCIINPEEKKIESLVQSVVLLPDRAHMLYAKTYNSFLAN